MKVLPLFALLFALIAWILTGWSTMAMLSGDDEARTCYTDCLQVLFFSGIATIVIALVLDGLALKYAKAPVLTYIGLALTIPLAMIYAGLILIGNLA